MKGKVTSVNFDEGHVLFLEGDTSNGLYLIQEGQVEIYRAREGMEVILSVLNPGDVIGTLTMISKGPRTASARAKTKCLMSFYPNDNLNESFKEIPLWAQAVIKDAVTRIKEINEKYIDAIVKERSLQKSIGNVFQHSSQLAYLLSSLMRKHVVFDEVNSPMYPIKDFLPQAEFILLKRFDYLEKIFTVFQGGGLIKTVHNQRYGKVIEKPNSQILEDYSNFAMTVAKRGTNYFVPSKLYKWMQALLRISAKCNNLEHFETETLIDFMQVELGRDDCEMILNQLAQHEVVRKRETSVIFSASKIQKTIIFETIAKLLKDVS
jgi:CRP/FNR family cyclic AMP-dependent transcriptional regulator